ncbi:MAG: heparinase II/III family protein [Verrucomicrobia bacterium]|nr:heparinase II/III family protein [Verrucomicrobiota bacterium]
MAESDGALAAELIARAVNTVPLSMHEYSPDGAYPEGPGYWGYGTSYNVMMISALQSALGTDFGLTQQPGFLATADYYLHVTGPSGYYFNYSDAGRGGKGVASAMFWFAAQRHEPYLLWTEWAKVQPAAGRGAARGKRDRTDPMLLLWLSPTQEKPTAPRALSWSAQGVTPVAFHRSDWTADATYVAIKGGSASTNHAHMDVGAFVMDADGVRWADDLGMQDYESIESKGINLWGKTQDAERWKIFRLGTSSHSVLMVDGQQQRVEGKAPIVLAKAGRTVVDLGTVYQGQLERARRGVALQPDRSVLVQDELQATAKAAVVRWAMVTRAVVTVDGAGRATLTQDGKKLSFRVLEPTGAALKIIPLDPPPAATDARNEGMRQIAFEVAVGAGGARRIVVQLAPGAGPVNAPAVQALAEW